MTTHDALTTPVPRPIPARAAPPPGPDAAEPHPDGGRSYPPAPDAELPDRDVPDRDVPDRDGPDRDVPDAAEDPAAVGPTRGPRWRAWPRRLFAPVALVALLAVSGGLLYAAHADRDPAASGNRALTDAAATAQVTGDVSDALSRIFAYAPDDTEATAQAARDLLSGTAAAQYQALFTRIRQEVARQRLTLSTRVVRAGVESLTAGDARLLIFLDQTAQRAGAPATTAAAQLTVTARLMDGRWRITDLKAR